MPVRNDPANAVPERTAEFRRFREFRESAVRLKLLALAPRVQ
jgi:hypothetical protein